MLRWVRPLVFWLLCPAKPIVYGSEVLAQVVKNPAGDRLTCRGIRGLPVTVGSLHEAGQAGGPLVRTTLVVWVWPEVSVYWMVTVWPGLNLLTRAVCSDDCDVTV